MLHTPGIRFRISADPSQTIDTGMLLRTINQTVSPATAQIPDPSCNMRVNGLYKTEVIRPRGPWRHIDEVEYATLEWVDWFNNRRLLEPIGDLPPAEFEQAFYDELESQVVAA